MDSRLGILRPLCFQYHSKDQPKLGLEFTGNYWINASCNIQHFIKNASFRPKRKMCKFDLKINRSMETLWQEYSGVAYILILCGVRASSINRSSKLKYLHLDKLITCLVACIPGDLVTWFGGMGWKILTPYPTTARGLIFEFNMAKARLELVGSTWMFIQ